MTAVDGLLHLTNSGFFFCQSPASHRSERHSKRWFFNAVALRHRFPCGRTRL